MTIAVLPSRLGRMDPIRLYVIFDPACAAGPAWVAMVDRAFASLGMQRDSRLFGVPVQRRSAPWGRGQPVLPHPRHPRQIDLSSASRNCLMVLVDAAMVRFNKAQWAEYMRPRPDGGAPCRPKWTSTRSLRV